MPESESVKVSDTITDTESEVEMAGLKPGPEPELVRSHKGKRKAEEFEEDLLDDEDDERIAMNAST